MQAVSAIRPHGAAEPRQEPRAAGSAEALFRAHADTVTRWVVELGGPSIDVEDAVQEVFVVVHRRLGEFRGDAKITTWLFRIASRVARHHRRRQRWRRWIGGSAEDVAGDRASPRRSPVEDYEQKEAVARLYRALDRMSERYRTVLVLAKIEGLPGEAIAALTGAKPATVRVWLHRATAEFKRLMREGEA